MLMTKPAFDARVVCGATRPPHAQRDTSARDQGMDSRRFDRYPLHAVYSPCGDSGIASADDAGICSD